MNQPKLYSKHNALQLTDNNFVLEKYLHLITWKENEDIFEIGIGDGKSTNELLLPRLPSDFKGFIGSDVSEDMIDYAKQNYKLSKVDFLQFDIQNKTIPEGLDDKFDHIFSFLCMHWIRNVSQAVANMYKMLKSGGEVLFSMAEKNSIDDVFYSLSRHPKWGLYGHEKFISRFFDSDHVDKEWEDILTATGFVDIKISKEHRVYGFEREESYKNFYLACNPVASRIPVEDLNEYLKDFFEECKKGQLTSIEYWPKTGRKIFKMNYHTIIIYAKKPIPPK